MHVRRADVVLHNGESVRRYFPLSEYISAANLTAGDNVLLFTDDANAIDEAHEFHSDLNWHYLRRRRHRGLDGGWENQIPSNNPKAEVIILLSIFELAKRCDRFVYSTSQFASMILDVMESTGQRVEFIKIGTGPDKKAEYSGSKMKLDSLLANRRANATLSSMPQLGAIG